jgi:acyl-CoA thioesterase-1
MMSVEYGRFTGFLKTLAVIVLTIGPAQAQSSDQKLTIFALGDSLTAGYGLNQGDGFTHQLEAWLVDQSINATVVNGGVSGDTTAGGVARLDWVLSDDIDAVLVSLGGNDMLRGIDPAATQVNLDRILSIVSNRNLPSLLISIPSPANFGEDYKDVFDQAYPTLAKKHKVPLYENFMSGIQNAASSQADALKFMQADAIHPTKEGVALIVAHMGPAVISMLKDAGLLPTTP